MIINWSKVRHFVHRRTYFCTAAVVEDGEVRLFPIGSLRIAPDGTAIYFEIFARPAAEGARINFLAVNLNPLTFLRALLKGSFQDPPALRLRGTLGPRRESTPQEQAAFHRRVGWLLKTRGGQALWSRPNRVREVRFEEVRAVRLGPMTRGLDSWLSMEGPLP